MNLRASETHAHPPDSAARRRHAGGTLVLSELDPLAVVDGLALENAPLDLLTFGNLREICPKCRRSHLKLVLRQESVRMAHLFCADCESCFDAHYANGVPALSI